MKANYTQIAIVLDRSGSMGSVRQATVEAFEGFMENQKKDPNQTDVLFVQFDGESPHDVVFDGDAKKFDKLQYSPRGSTPLHDAMGWTITTLGRRLEGLPEAERPDKVLIVIMTDGEENSSLEYNHASVAELVKHQQDNYNWQFLFLGANQDAVLTAKTYNIAIHASSCFDPSSTGMRSAIGAMNATTDMWKYSNSNAKIEITDEQRKLYENIKDKLTSGNQSSK